MAIQGLLGYKSIDVNGIVSKLMTAERAPIRDMDKRISTLNSRISALNKIEGQASNLRAEYGNLRTLSGSATPESVKGALESFVKAYNEMSGNVRTTTGKGGTLQGESMITRLQSDLRLQVSRGFESGSVSSLRDLGISLSKEGVMSLNTAKLDDALSADPGGVIGALQQFGDAGASRIAPAAGFDGFIKRRADGMQSEISRINDRKDRMEDRLDKVEERYHMQFARADQAMTVLNGGSTGSNVNTWA